MNHPYIQSKMEAYSIDFIPGVLQKKSILKSLLEDYGKCFAIVADEITTELYGTSLLKTLQQWDFESSLFTIPSGEKNKTRETKAILENKLLENGLGKDTTIIALGGGVVTDLVGYLAATYTRGVPLILIPTTLMGMVDASLGGKNGVNTPYGKNLIGTHYTPKKIIMDIETLNSLSKKEIRNGVAEMIKHGLIEDKHYFDFLFDFANGIMALDSSLLTQAIIKSCEIKTSIIGKEERETGKRHLLNFGHTIGHAIEKVTDFSISHGEAVAIGLVVESYISTYVGGLSKRSFEQILSLFAEYEISLNLPPEITVESMQKAMASDKKSLKRHPRFVVIKEIGYPLDFEGQYCSFVEESILLEALNWMIHDMCGY